MRSFTLFCFALLSVACGGQNVLTSIEETDGSVPVVEETPPPSDTGTDPCSSRERRLADIDGDGYGDPNNYQLVGVCEPWADGYVNWIEGRDDCNDNDPTVNPGAGEYCGDDVDQDCNGSVDTGTVVIVHPDVDGDGYGSTDNVPASCNPIPDGYVANADDCDDTNPNIYPGHGC